MAVFYVVVGVSQSYADENGGRKNVAAYIVISKAAYGVMIPSFVVKATPARRLADAGRRVHAGLRAARGGRSVSDFAGTVFLSEGTVGIHPCAAIGRTGARNRADAVRIAEQNGRL